MNELVQAAAEARKNAYAPYSNYPVGAAARSADGRIWSGANVENVAFSPSICAERAAIAKMVNDGARELSEVAVVTRDGGTPCGVCLQVMLEFAPNPADVKVLCADENGEVKEYALAALLPHGFKTQLEPRT
ncbi:MAG TPA: cytidine deaminase [Fimbriimonadaceae bacterium]|nr:cytidine deaminase [Fimbriimonadaceae bacterium]